VGKEKCNSVQGAERTELRQGNKKRKGGQGMDS